MPQLIRTEPKYVMQPRIGLVEIERVVQLALLAENTGRQIVGKSAIALGKAGEMTVARGIERRSGADIAENPEGRATGGSCCPNPTSPWLGMTASPLHAAASALPETPRVPRSSRVASRAPSLPDPARPRSQCSSGYHPRPAPSSHRHLRPFRRRHPRSPARASGA